MVSGLNALKELKKAEIIPEKGSRRDVQYKRTQGQPEA
jgi:hypothetical protein